jgi:hypothetical protein
MNTALKTLITEAALELRGPNEATEALKYIDELLRGVGTKGLSKSKNNELNYVCRGIYDALRSGSDAPDWAAYPQAAGFYRFWENL